MPVLTATDGGPYAEAALHLGAQIAQRGHEALTILTVIKHEADRLQAPGLALQAQAREIVQHYCPDVKTRVRTGHPATEIVRVTKEGNFDMVIVGVGSSRNHLPHLLLGSTAVRVVEHAPCPVIVAKGRIRPIQRVLLCDSGSQDPSLGLPSASSFSTGPGVSRIGPSVLGRFLGLPIDLLDGSAEMVVLHVMSQMSAGPGTRGEHLRTDSEKLIEEKAPEGELLQRDIEALESIGIRARAKVRHGLVVDEILLEAAEQDYDLVVIGAYRSQGWQRILLDDLGQRLVVALDRSVLVLR